MGKQTEKKNIVKLKLISSAESKNSIHKWVLASNSNYTDEERQKIENLVGDVIFPDEYEQNLLIEENDTTFASSSDNNTCFSPESIADLSQRDDYFPDDGYDYEKHLCKINGDKFIRNLNNKNNNTESRESLIFSSTSILDNHNTSLDDSQTINELNEIFDCFDEVEDFEELNDDFILDATGFDNIDDVDKNINLYGLLWGENYLHLSKEGEKSSVNEKLMVNKNYGKIQNSDLLFGDSDDAFAETLEEYDEPNICLNKNEIKNKITVKDSIDNKKYSYNEYEKILDEYIRQAKCQHVKKNKQEKVLDINLPLEKPQIEKIMSIIDQISFESPSDKSDIETFDDEIVNITQIPSQSIHQNNNKPKRVEITQIYPNLAPISKTMGQTILKEEIYDKYDLINNHSEHLCPFLTNRNKNETPDEKKERKNAVKQAKREMREIKRRNKQDTKNLKNLLVSNFIGTNHYDIKSGYRHFRF
ncbi:hypothetical protein FG386_000034 [Cryptosporidium ryanae]|uniref:uncharacterized protein n=1 Tax=Cryptosporidium ryanae TaxID=515981 RepID=UPI003519EF39|nr:hypothetical protein FG386_000034 [Cryptosporidium ryanae]